MDNNSELPPDEPGQAYAGFPQEPTNENSNVIVFPYFSRLNTEEVDVNNVTVHYMKQLYRLLQIHGFDVDDGHMQQDMVVISLMLEAALARNVGAPGNNFFQNKMDEIIAQYLDGEEIDEEE